MTYSRHRRCQNKDEKKFRLAIIGGTSSLLTLWKWDKYIRYKERLSTPFGRSGIITTLRIDGEDLLFLERYGTSHRTIYPSIVNYKANAYALKKLQINCVVGLSSVGSINPRLKVGDIVVPNDFIDMTKCRPNTMFGRRGHGFTRMNPPFCPSVSSFITKGAKSVGWNRVISGGVYICMEGPRLETPAEVRMLRLLRGDIVGMPIATEAILFRELELCYGALCFVVNKAEGLLPFVNTPSSDGLVPPDERSIEERMRKILGKILIVVSSRLRISDDKKCICLRAQEEAKLDGILSDSWEKWFSDTNI